MISQNEFQKRLEELKALPPLKTNEGFQVTLAWVGKWFIENLVTYPYLYPNFEGGVRLEWVFERKDISIDLSLKPFQFIFHTLDLLTGRSELETGKEIERLNLILKNLGRD